MILTIEGILSGVESDFLESESYIISGVFFFSLKTQKIVKIFSRLLKKAIKIKGSEALLT